MIDAAILHEVFVWTRMEERVAAVGVFWWGVGNSISTEEMRTMLMMGAN
jgi:hypothetical protein